MLDLILVSHSSLHTSGGVIKYNFSDHYLIYSEFAFKTINAKKSPHNTVKFRDMKQINLDIFINDKNNCEILNGSVHDQDI